MLLRSVVEVALDPASLRVRGGPHSGSRGAQLVGLQLELDSQVGRLVGVQPQPGGQQRDQLRMVLAGQPRTQVDSATA